MTATMTQRFPVRLSVRESYQCALSHILIGGVQEGRREVRKKQDEGGKMY